MPAGARAQNWSARVSRNNYRQQGCTKGIGRARPKQSHTFLLHCCQPPYCRIKGDTNVDTRRSVCHQQYSLENQSARIKRYADDNGFAVIRSYEDVLKSCLKFRNRPGLCPMLRDVLGRQTDYKAILVLDASRWGGFQDIDESAPLSILVQAGWQDRSILLGIVSTKGYLQRLH